MTSASHSNSGVEPARHRRSGDGSPRKTRQDRRRNAASRPLAFCPVQMWHDCGPAGSRSSGREPGALAPQSARRCATAACSLQPFHRQRRHSSACPLAHGSAYRACGARRKARIIGAAWHRHERHMYRAVAALVRCARAAIAPVRCAPPTGRRGRCASSRRRRRAAPPTCSRRLLCDHFSETFRERCFVENRAGAGGLIGTAATAQAAPDGYTLTTSSTAYHVIAPAVSPNPGFDPIKDFTHIAYIGGPPNVFVVNPALGVRSLKRTGRARPARPADRLRLARRRHARPSAGGIASRRRPASSCSRS